MELNKEGFLQHNISTVEKSSSADNISIIIAVYVYLTYVILPFVSVWLPQIVRYGVVLMLVVFSFIGAALSDKKNALKTTASVCGILLFVWLIFKGKWEAHGTNFISYMVNAYMFWLPLTIAPAVSKLSDKRKKRMLIYAFVLISVTIVTTIAGSYIYDNSSRIMSSGVTGNVGNEVFLYARMNIGGYGFVYSLVVLMPFLFFRFKNSEYKWVYAIMIAGAIYTIFVTQYTIALAAVAGLIIALVIFSGNRSYKAIIGIISGVILVFLLRNVIMDVFRAVEDFFYSKGLNFLSDRLGLLIELLDQNTISGDALVRSNLYEMSWDAFWENPLSGNLAEYNTLGGHSELLDILGATGIIGFTIFAVVFSRHTKLINSLNNTDAYKYCIFSLILFFFVASFNTVFTSSQIAISLFMIPALIPKEEIKPTERKSPSVKFVFRRG